MSETSPPEAKRYVEIALPVPLRKLFTYRLPAGFAGVARIGARVSVPFGRQKLVGYIVNFRNEIDPETHLRDTDIKDIEELLDEDPLLSDEIIQLTKWAADYYATSWGEMLKASLPAGISSSSRVRPMRRKAIRLLSVDRDSENFKKLTEQHRQIIDVLESAGGEALFTDVLSLAGVGASPINTLAKRRFIEIEVREVFRDPLSKSEKEDADDFTLTTEQAGAFSAIQESIAEKQYAAFLLHGVTGSGKTEVYIRAMRSALEAGRSSLMLVPEIALTPVFSRRLRAGFGEEVAILHSNLSAGERYDEWRRIRNGGARIVIGTRSAIFAPLHQLGLIIVDEEHDTSYRQNEMPYYHGRDLAVMRASMTRSVIVLGSATPSLETFDNAHAGKYRYLRLPDRIGGRPLAKAELVDMRDVFRRSGGKDVILSPQLIEAIEETHAKGEQTMILLNRRGFSTFVLCRSCGESLRCKNCDITMTYHRGSGQIVCHYCSYSVLTPKACPFCESEFLYFIGQGTEQVEEVLRKRFPKLTIARVDRDSMKRKGELAKTLSSFDKGEIDILLGTQMIAKGHDFHNVTLVGVISVDTGLGLPDFRSAERTFQLLTQVAGRAGRGQLPGKVLIQSYYPEHYALRHAVNQDFEGFYKEEMRYRERLGYPPYFVLASIMIVHRKLEYAVKNAQILRDSLDRADPEKRARILGPAQASIARIKNQYRQQIILKSQNRRELRLMLDKAFAEAEARGCDLRIVQMEIDPVDLM